MRGGPLSKIRNLRYIFLMAPVISLFVVVHALAQTPKHLRIAMILWRGETPAEAGFKHEMKRLGYEPTYVEINADQNRGVLHARFEKVILPQLETFSYIYSYGTTASQMTKELVHGRVPQLFDVSTYPMQAGIVPNLTRPGDNISGTSNLIPLSVQIRAAEKLFPIKRLGLLFNPREQNSLSQRAALEKVAERDGIKLIDLRSPPVLDALKRSLHEIADRKVAVDAVYLPEDSYLITEAKLIGETLRSAKIKSIAANQAFVDAGALMGSVPSYYAMGEELAQILQKNQKGEPLGNIPVAYPTRPVLVINTATAEALGLHIPDAVLDHALKLK